MIDSVRTNEAAPTNVACVSQKCPNCGADVPVHTGYVTWCENCKWNLEPKQNDIPNSFYESLTLKLSKRFGEQQFKELAQAPELKPSITPTKVVAVLIALSVHAFTIALLILGVTLIIVTKLSASLLFAAIFLGLVWLMRPRIAKLPTDDLANREDFPALYKLADQISESLGAKPVDIIVLDNSFNASFGRAGWRRKDVLAIGLPLFEILGPQERVALLAHELGHGVNGDPTRSFVVWWAVYALGQWYSVFPSLGHRASRTNEIAFGTFIANMIMIPLAQIPRLWLELLALLMFRDQQRAEYLADHLAAEAAGTEGELQLLRKLHMSQIAWMTVRRFYLNNLKGNLFEAIKTQVINVPQRELMRIDQVERMDESRIDTSHPPTARRIDLLKARNVREPKIVLNEVDNAAINKEIASIEPERQNKLLSYVDSGSYYGSRH